MCRNRNSLRQICDTQDGEPRSLTPCWASGYTFRRTRKRFRSLECVAEKPHAWLLGVGPRTPELSCFRKKARMGGACGGQTISAIIRRRTRLCCEAGDKDRAQSHGSNPRHRRGWIAGLPAGGARTGCELLQRGSLSVCQTPILFRRRGFFVG